LLGIGAVLDYSQEDGGLGIRLRAGRRQGTDTASPKSGSSRLPLSVLGLNRRRGGRLRPATDFFELTGFLVTDEFTQARLVDLM
jgi:hypothetical protein